MTDAGDGGRRAVSPLPNAVTVARLVVAAACMACLELAGPSDEPRPAVAAWALGLFVVAASSDWVDGWLARRLDAVTRFGRIVDPMVDKVLVLGVLVVLLRFDAVRSFLPAWTVAVMVVREVVVTTIRGVLEGEGHEFPADRLGKWKMVVQSLVCAASLAVLVWGPPPAPLGWTLAAAVGLAVFLTVASGLGYVVRGLRILGTAR